MEESEERPRKIRKIEVAAGDSRLHTLDHSPMVGLAEGAHGSSTLLPNVVNKSADEEDQSPDNDNAIYSPNANEIQNQEENQNQSEPQSRNELKRQRKKQEWEAGREDRKARRKEKMREKKARKAQERVSASLNATEEALPSEDPRRKNHVRSIQVPITFILDCDFDDLMTEPEMISLGSQLTRSYSDNKGSPYRAHIVISSFGGKLKQRFETVLASNHLGWKGVKFVDEDFVAAARDADAVMRGSQGGRVVGALAEQAHTTHPTANPLSSNVEAVTKLPETNVDMLPEAGEDDDHGNLPQAPEQAIIDPMETYSDSHEKPTAGEAFSNLCEPSVASSTMALKDKPTDIKAASPSPASVPVPVPAPPPTPSIIYLTSDSPNTLTHLSPYTSYIIGGLVDKNRHKGLCYKRAMALDIPTAKLPIGEYMTMQSRTVLATNHVVEIMVRWLEEGDWGKAFLRVIPKRKEARLRVKGDGTGEVLGGEEGEREEGQDDRDREEG